MKPFEFATVARVVVGAGAARSIGTLAGGFGSHALVVTGRSTARAADLQSALGEAGIAATTCSVVREPDLAAVEAGVALARQAGCDFVVAMGGGSALDAGKAMAALLANDGALLDYLEVIGRGAPLRRPALPCVAMPTTAGTGSEVTTNSVLFSPSDRVKVSLRSPLMLPRLAILDPALTLTVPPPLTASTGLDALTQLIEGYVSARATPITDALCREGIRLAARALPEAWSNGSNIDARETMLLAAHWSGMALANGGLGAVHGLAGPIGGMFAAPHGAICAALLPGVCAANIAALRSAGSPAATSTLARYDDVARLLTGQARAVADDGVRRLQDLIGSFGTPRLGTYGVTGTDFGEIIAKARRASSMKANPVTLSDEELGEVLDGA